MGIVRFLLALCVVVTHAPGGTIFGVRLLSGIVAVQAFYVISGFLITMILNERKQYRYIGNFYLSRYLRLWPVYIIVALLSFLFTTGAALRSLYPPDYGLSAIIFIWVSNFTIFFQDFFLMLRFDNGYLVPTFYWHDWPPPWLNSYLLVPQAWTLGVELTFYAIAPFVCHQWWRLGCLFLFGLGVRMLMGIYLVPAHDPWLYRFSPAEMTLFAAGGLAYFAGRRLQCYLNPKAFGAVAFAALGAWVVIILGNQLVTEQYLYGYDDRLYLACPKILLLMIVSCPFLLLHFQQNKLDSIIGEMSYPMYISHLFVAGLASRLLFVAGIASRSKVHEWPFFNVCYVLVTLAFSALLVFVVILPVDRLRSRLGARSP
jgi:peptidoglycan/LPS O-acetylase OafA/YrhL